MVLRPQIAHPTTDYLSQYHLIGREPFPASAVQHSLILCVIVVSFNFPLVNFLLITLEFNFDNVLFFHESYLRVLC